MRRTTSLLMAIPNASVICCAIRGEPHVGVPPFHIDDSGHHFLSRPLWTWLRLHVGREQPAIFPLGQRSMKAEARGGLQDDRGTEQSPWADEERTVARDDAIGDPKTG
jgi:hypothetical protein